MVHVAVCLHEYGSGLACRGGMSEAIRICYGRYHSKAKLWEILRATQAGSALGSKTSGRDVPAKSQINYRVLDNPNPCRGVPKHTSDVRKKWHPDPCLTRVEPVPAVSSTTTDFFQQFKWTADPRKLQHTCRDCTAADTDSQCRLLRIMFIPPKTFYE